MSRQSIVNLAISQLGKPYELGADSVYHIKLDDPSPRAFDCSFFVEWCYWHEGKLTLPRTAQDQFDFCKSTDNPLPADLGFFKDEKEHIYHVGIVIDDNKVIEARGHQDHTTFETGKVIIRPLIVWRSYNNILTGHKFAGWRVHPNLV